MADPSAFYEPEEDDLLTTLTAPPYQNGNEADYDPEEYSRHQEIDQQAYRQQVAAAEAEHEQAQMAALELVPEDVKRFLVSFHQAILENDLQAITTMYESGWNKLTQVSCVLALKVERTGKGSVDKMLIYENRLITPRTNGQKRS